MHGQRTTPHRVAYQHAPNHDQLAAQLSCRTDAAQHDAPTHDAPTHVAPTHVAPGGGVRRAPRRRLPPRRPPPPMRGRGERAARGRPAAHILAAFGALGRASRAHRRRTHALKRTFAAFRATHPAWAEACFDLHLVRHGGADAFAAADPIALAQAWTRQFRYADERRRCLDARRVRPVAEAFLELWAKEAGVAR